MMNCNMEMEAEIYPFLPTLLWVLVFHCRGKLEECFAVPEQNAVVRATYKKYMFMSLRSAGQGSKIKTQAGRVVGQDGASLVHLRTTA